MSTLARGMTLLSVVVLPIATLVFQSLSAVNIRRFGETALVAGVPVIQATLIQWLVCLGTIGLSVVLGAMSLRTWLDIQHLRRVSS